MRGCSAFRRTYSCPAKLSSFVLQVFATLDDTLDHGYLRLTYPLARVVVALVGFICTFGVANLPLQISTLCFVEIEQSFPICPLSVRVNVHFDDSKAHCRVNLFGQRARAAMEDEKIWLVVA